MIFLLQPRAVSKVGVFSRFILWLLFFYVLSVVRQAYARYLTVVSVLCTRTKCFRKKTSNDCVKYSVRLRCKLTARSMFFLLGVKGGLLFLITKKEKSPLKPRCSLSNKIVSGQACLQNRLKPKWFYNVLNKALARCRLVRQKGTLNPRGFENKESTFRTES